jgi:hypothetical protein
MNRHRPRWTAALVGAGLLVTVTACAGTPQATRPPAETPAAAATTSAAPESATSSPPAASEPATPMELEVSHIHAAVRDPQTGALLLATHEGLYRQDGSELRQVGPIIDLMGFAVDPAGTLYASGHPSREAGLPEPVGLITSSDGGNTWQVASRGGESDFHALAVGGSMVVGFDGAFRATEDRQSWTTRDLNIPVIGLAASPQEGTLLATTQAGMIRSGDAGATWERLSPPEAAVLVAWADDTTAVAATVTGKLAFSDDGGLTWTLGPQSIGQVMSLSAQRAANDQVEVIAVVDGTAIATTDYGASTEVLAR